MIRLDRQPSFILGNIKHTIGRDLPQLFVCKIVDPNFFRSILRSPFRSIVLKIPNQLFFLWVNRYHRLSALLKSRCKSIDVFKLGVSLKEAGIKEI
jgi:hypothetical protein